MKNLRFLPLLLAAACYPWLLRPDYAAQVHDAVTGRPIAGAEVLVITGDDFGDPAGAAVFRTRTDSSGSFRLPGERKWGPIGVSPHANPSPWSFVSVSAPGYHSFVFSSAFDGYSGKSVDPRAHLRIPPCPPVPSSESELSLAAQVLEKGAVSLIPCSTCGASECD